MFNKHDKQFIDFRKDTINITSTTIKVHQAVQVGERKW